jgi:Family of unknown function (DUF6328)
VSNDPQRNEVLRRPNQRSASRPATQAKFESLEDEARQVVEEARMVLPGIQALFGFQLIAVFNQRYAELSPSEQHMHLGALVLIGVSVALIMTPAAYHRQAEPGQVSRYFIALTSRLLALAMLVLALGICLDIYIVARLTLMNAPASAAIAGTLLSIYLGAWFVFPRLKMWRRLGASS